MLTGTITIPKELSDSDAWTSAPFSDGQAIIDLWFLANDRPRTLNVRGVNVHLKRGQVGWAQQRLMERWGWSKTKLRNFLTAMQDERHIKLHEDEEFKNVVTVITVVDYAAFNPTTEPAKDTAENPPEKPAKDTADEPAKEPQKYRRWEVSGIGSKEGKKRGSAAPAFEIPSESAVLAWARAWPGDPEQTIPAGMPEAWVRNWFNWRMERPERFPEDWHGDLKRRFAADWLEGRSETRILQKNGAPGGRERGEILQGLALVRDELKKTSAGPVLDRLKREGAELVAELKGANV